MAKGNTLRGTPWRAQTRRQSLRAMPGAPWAPGVSPCAPPSRMPGAPWASGHNRIPSRKGHHRTLAMGTLRACPSSRSRLPGTCLPLKNTASESPWIM